MDLADLFRTEGSQCWITVCRSAAIAGASQGDWLLRSRIVGLLIGASLLRSVHFRLVDSLVFCSSTGLYSPSLCRHRNAQQHRQHQAGCPGQIADLISPGLAAKLGPGDVHHRDLQPGAPLLLAQVSGPADATAEGGAGGVHHLRQIGSGDGGHLGLEAGQGLGELLLGGDVTQGCRQRLDNREASRISGVGCRKACP